MAAQGKTCYMTLVMSDSYLPGAMVLGHSLKDSGTTHDLVALVTLDTLSVEVVDELKTLYHIIPVDRIPNPKPANLYLMNRPDLLYAFTKIALWRQTQYKKIVYLDADIVVLRNLDELFDIAAPFAAAPDVGWPDAFNSGLMVLTPAMGDYWAIRTLSQSGDSFDGADQGLLNQFYEHKPWHRLSFTYNCTPNAEYQWEPAYRYYKSTIKTVHFIGKDKPWFVGRQQHVREGIYTELVAKWWSTYDRHYKTAPQYIPGKSYLRSKTVQELVFGEHVDMYYGVPESERLPLVSSTDVAPSFVPEKHNVPSQLQKKDDQVPSVPVREPSPQPREPSQPPPQPHPQPHPQHNESPQHQAPPFQPPEMEWDATRSAPPAKSRPEAASFPTQHYTFDDQERRFHAPKKYPEPPKDMWYNVPAARAAPEAPPKPIFPWETTARTRGPTRVFAEDFPPTLEQEKVTSPLQTSWADSSGGMEQYIRNIMQQSAQNEVPASNIPEVTTHTGRRDSLLFTGLPAAVNRPSLPVTPAPIISKHSYFETDDDGKIEHPEVLPDQAEWNPEAKLEELRRSSLVEVVTLVQPTRLQAAPPPKNRSPLSSSTSAGEVSSNPFSPKEESSDSVSTLDIETDDNKNSIVKTLEKAAELHSADSQTDAATQATESTPTQSGVTFTTPNFSEQAEGRPTKSPGSFSAETALLDSINSPTER